MTIWGDNRNFWQEILEHILMIVVHFETTGLGKKYRENEISRSWRYFGEKKIGITIFFLQNKEMISLEILLLPSVYLKNLGAVCRNELRTRFFHPREGK